MQKIDIIPSHPTDDDQPIARDEEFLNDSDRSGLSEAQQEQANQKQQTIRSRDKGSHSGATEVVNEKSQRINSQADKLPAAGAKLVGADSLWDGIKEAVNTKTISESLNATVASEEVKLLGVLVPIATFFLLCCSYLYLIILGSLVIVSCLVWVGYRSIQRSVKQELDELKEKHKKDNQDWEQRYTADIRKWEDKFKESESVSERRIKDLKSEIHANDDNNRKKKQELEEWKAEIMKKIRESFQQYIECLNERDNLLKSERDENERLRQKLKEVTQTDK